MRRALATALVVALTRGASAEPPPPAQPGAARAERPVDGAPPAASAAGTGEVTAVARARELGHAGISAYAEERYGEALRLFGEAEELAHSPVFQLYMARCLARLAQLGEARALYSAIAAGAEEPEAPEAFGRARADARAELAALELAESEVPSVATLPPARRTAAASGTAAPAPLQAAVSVSSPGWSPQRWAALTAFSLGAASLTAGAVLGGLALARADEVKAGCVGTSCLPSDAEKAEEAQRLANLATVGFTMAAVGGALGVTLLLLDRETEGDGEKARLGLELGPTHARLRGSF